MKTTHNPLCLQIYTHHSFHRVYQIAMGTSSSWNMDVIFIKELGLLISTSKHKINVFSREVYKLEFGQSKTKN